MLKSKDILYSYGHNDECYTPSYAVIPIIKYLPKDKIIWCPFDTDESEFTRQLSLAEYKIVNSHICNGQNYYTYEPVSWDIMVSNPPYTNKRKIFERALSFNKPFALLMSNTWLNDSTPKQLFKTKQLQLLMFDKRIKYLNNGIVNNKITFSSSYYCYNLLPRDIICEEL
ncbi:MAG: tRNA (adenine-N(6)-)-methyltransferase [Ruminococcus sp.]|nr:tRNA (adenine-N(6)-)-methyltransferase [Ruminococcus sp.]